MKKKILMIGNTNNLPGVPVDISACYSFFTSPIGGNWSSEEIDILMNPTLRCLLRKIAAIERAECDYVITIFSGHGEEADDGTVLTINGQGERMMMSALTNLSQRQLLIIDCCRVSMPIDIDFTQAGATMLSMSRDPIRQAYEERILVSLPQEVILFACDEGETAMDSPDGGEYLRYLLTAAQMLSTDSRFPFVSVGQAHYKAVAMMQDDLSMIQNPQILQPRCALEQRLPFVVNAGFFL
jgi:hypothetical protein